MPCAFVPEFRPMSRRVEPSRLEESKSAAEECLIRYNCSLKLTPDDVALKNTPVHRPTSIIIEIVYFFDFFGNKTEWMFGKTPPLAMVTVPRSLDSSSSLRIANWMWRGTMRDFLLSRLALPANSSTSAHKYSSTAAKYTGAPAPTRVAYLPCFK